MPFRNMFNWDQIKKITAETTLDAVDLTKYKVYVMYAGGNLILPSGSAACAEAGPVWVLNETVASGAVVSGNSTFVGGVDTCRIPVSGAALFQCVPYSGDIWHWAAVPANDTTSVTATSILATSGMFTGNTEHGVSGVATASKINLGIDFGDSTTSGLYGAGLWSGYSGAFGWSAAVGASPVYSGRYRKIGTNHCYFTSTAWVTDGSGRTGVSGVLPLYAQQSAGQQYPLTVFGYAGTTASGLSGAQAAIEASGTSSGNLFTLVGVGLTNGKAAVLTVAGQYECIP